MGILRSEVIAGLRALIQQRYDFAHKHAALTNNGCKFELRNNRAWYSFSYIPNRWYIRDLSHKHGVSEFQLWPVGVFREPSLEVPTDEIAGYLELFKTMKVSIPAPESFGLVDIAGIIRAILNCEAFEKSNGILHIVKGTSIPGILHETDVVRRLRTLWELYRAGHMVNISKQLSRVRDRHMYRCADGNVRWLEFEIGMPNTSPAFLPATRYLRYSVTPFQPVAATSTYREHV